MNADMNDSNRDGRAVLLVNLGSPASASVADVRHFLREFLMDARVLDMPHPLRFLIVNGIIAPFRAKPSAEAYRSIWTDEGSPLIVHSQRVCDQLAARLPMPIELAMRYPGSSIPDALQRLHTRSGDRLREIFLVPMFPQYAMSTYETVVAAVAAAMRNLKSETPLRVLEPYYDHPAYISSLSASIADHISWDYDHLLLSYHGLPLRHLRKSDPTGKHCLSGPDCCTTPSPAHARCYRAQTLATTEALINSAGIPREKFSISYQSRFGKDTWLTPFTDAEIVRLPQSGVKRLCVICPAFTTDCLETIEELGDRGKEEFLAAGGEEFRLVPSLNDHPEWIETLAHWCKNEEGVFPESFLDRP